MADESDTTPIHSLYAQRFAADLEINRKEQESLSVQITELEARLKQLKSDESWLSGMQGTLAPTDGTAPRSPAAAPAADSATVPAPKAVRGAVPKPRQAKKAAAGTSRTKKAAPAKKAATANAAGTEAKAQVAEVQVARAQVTKAQAAKAEPAKAQVAKAKPAPRKTASTTAATATAAEKAEKGAPVAAGRTEPPLRELILTLLVGAAEPRLVNEITTELAQAHPGRPASTQVVRNTLEALTKKGAIEKEHKQGSVMYTAPAPGGTPVPEAPTPAPAEVADEKAAVKV
ncbi:hypothetical protein J7E97_09670 [Streptomyces sp. ISL-66]|uniref:hypothetical protein n=1 Tax=Streptomyces sp. ISL-66 TaxID=2819186 RepID=UPI001BEA97D5|nr:hypothetical protein [Streptomyces sp. ISL-66]MBT2468139.1 hypothetical protein [Streptomyces sp. ISL-66]